MACTDTVAEFYEDDDGNLHFYLEYHPWTEEECDNNP